MKDDLRRGIKGQLVGLNLWVVCVFLGFLLYVALLSSFFGFVLVVLILLLFFIGTFRVLRGLFLMIRGSTDRSGRVLGTLSVLMLLTSPFVIGLSFISPTPINYFLLQVGLWSFLASIILPYLKGRGLLTGIPAILSSTGFSIVILGFILFGQVTLPWGLPFGFAMTYFIFLEITLFISYLRALKLEEFVPSSGTGVSITPVVGSPMIFTRGQNFSDLKADLEPISRKNTPEIDPSDIRRTSERSVEKPKVKSFEDFVNEMGVPSTRTPPSGTRSTSGTSSQLKFKTIPKQEKKIEAEVEEEIYLDMEDILIDGEDLYSILRVPRSATLLEMRKAYRKRALLYHPDLNRGVGELYRETINEEMRKLNKAKEVLFDPLIAI